MKNLSLGAAAAVVLIANTFSLIHAARNRSGEPDARITLTERELTFYRDPDDSGVELRLTWRDGNSPFFKWEPNAGEIGPGLWLDRQKLQALGFDCGVAPSDPKAPSFYARQLPRPAFIALRYTGQEQPRPQRPEQPQSTQLAVIDAASDATALRSRYPDRKSVLVVPAVIRMYFSGPVPAINGQPARPARVTGAIQETASSIHVPLPFSDGFPRHGEKAHYRVHLRYGKLFEPSVEGVEFVGK
jgi:hypothetical protein